jgi:hypothetical protein
MTRLSREAALVTLALLSFGGKATCAFIRSDADGDGKVGIADSVMVLRHLFLGTQAPGCLDAADFNDDGIVDIDDPIYTLKYLFRGEAPPPAPFPSCAEDPTADTLGCEKAHDCGGAPPAA